MPSLDAPLSGFQLRMDFMDVKRSSETGERSKLIASLVLFNQILK